MSNLRVICIDGNWEKGTDRPTYHCPKEGDIVTVVRSVKYMGVWCYKLLEYTNIDFWEQENFIPLSQIDETEMTRENLNENNLVKK